jgi:proline racemase
MLCSADGKNSQNLIEEITMRGQNIFDVIYTHTEGEPLCIIPSGIVYPENSSILEKRKFLEERYDWLRRALMQEPRGHKDMYGVFVTPPSSHHFDAGMIYIDGTGYSHMCGHGTISLSMTMVARGMVREEKNGRTPIRFETTAGPVTAEVASENGNAAWTRFENVPAYVATQNVPVELPEIGTLKADIVWGGNYFAIVDLRNTALKIDSANAAALSHYGILAREQLRQKVKLRHPTAEHINNLDYVTFWHEPTIGEAIYKCVHVFGAGQMDRSPGGTGTSAMMAMLEARGQIKLNQTIRSEGLLGSGTFEGCLIGETKLGSVRAVRSTIKGMSSILGTARWEIDHQDRTGSGFVIG